MQRYLHRVNLGSVMDALGLRLLLVALGMGWFVALWGLTVPALLAGAALTVLMQWGLNRLRRRSVGRREDALRRRLGGEMLLERMLLAPPRQAHFQAALLLGEKYPLVMERVVDAGVICSVDGDRVLVACVALPEGCDADAGDLAQLRRHAAMAEAVRCVACMTGGCNARAEAWAAEGPLPVRVIHRSEMLALAGCAAPATDGQLVELGRRKKRLAPAALVRMALRRDKAKTYLTYGLMLTVMGVATGLAAYTAPGLISLGLAAASRIRRAPPAGL